MQTVSISPKNGIPMKFKFSIFLIMPDVIKLYIWDPHTISVKGCNYCSFCWIVNIFKRSTLKKIKDERTVLELSMEN